MNKENKRLEGGLGVLSDGLFGGRVILSDQGINPGTLSKSSFSEQKLFPHLRVDKWYSHMPISDDVCEAFAERGYRLDRVRVGGRVGEAVLVHRLPDDADNDDDDDDEPS